MYIVKDPWFGSSLMLAPFSNFYKAFLCAILKKHLSSVEFKKTPLELLWHSHLIDKESFHLFVFWRDVFFQFISSHEFLGQNGYKFLLGIKNC